MSTERDDFFVRKRERWVPATRPSIDASVPRRDSLQPQRMPV